MLHSRSTAGSAILEPHFIFVAKYFSPLEVTPGGRHGFAPSPSQVKGLAHSLALVVHWKEDCTVKE